jgi:hypothetical protein
VFSGEAGVKRFFLIAIFVAFSSPGVAQTKADLFGFEPGMTSQAAQQLIAAKSYVCKTVPGGKSPNMECTIDGSEVIAYVSKELKDNPVVSISVGLPPTASVAARAATIADQFAVPVGKDKKGRWTWVVGKENVLTYSGAGLLLNNPKLKKLDEEADASAAKRGTPKF